MIFNNVLQHSQIFQLNPNVYSYSNLIGQPRGHPLLSLWALLPGAQHIPAGTGEAHNVLTKQTTTLLWGDIVQEHRKEITSLELWLPAFKELIRVHSMTPWYCQHFWQDIFQDKGKDNALVINLEPEVQGSRKRKSPMISGYSFQPPKSMMKSYKYVKLKQFVESEDEEDTIVQLSCSPSSLKEQSFGPASLTASSCLEVMKSPISRPEAMATSGSHPEVIEPTDNTTSTLDSKSPAISTFDITIPSPIPQNNPCHYYTKEDAPPRKSDVSLYLWESCLNMSESCGYSKIITGRKTPAPAPAPVPFSSFAVPHAVLNVPMLDLHSMAIAIRDGTARICYELGWVSCRWFKREPSFTKKCLQQAVPLKVRNLGWVYTEKYKCVSAESEAGSEAKKSRCVVEYGNMCKQAKYIAKRDRTGHAEDRRLGKANAKIKCESTRKGAIHTLVETEWKYSLCEATRNGVSTPPSDKKGFWLDTGSMGLIPCEAGSRVQSRGRTSETDDNQAIDEECSKIESGIDT
ncbi:hypothetical protein EDD22DRAFT_849172 [Suillus occidentalis]|nr:hypothetical protein EDD22DRAFT_849172 [Suillus occidentalis]